MEEVSNREEGVQLPTVSSSSDSERRAVGLRESVRRPDPINDASRVPGARQDWVSRTARMVRNSGPSGVSEIPYSGEPRDPRDPRSTRIPHPPHGPRAPREPRAPWEEREPRVPLDPRIRQSHHDGVDYHSIRPQYEPRGLRASRQRAIHGDRVYLGSWRQPTLPSHSVSRRIPPTLYEESTPASDAPITPGTVEAPTTATTVQSTEGESSGGYPPFQPGSMDERTTHSHRERRARRRVHTTGRLDQAFSGGPVYRSRSDPLISGREGMLRDNNGATTTTNLTNVVNTTTNAANAVNAANAANAVVSESGENTESAADLLESFANDLDNEDDRMFLRELQRYLLSILKTTKMMS